MSVSNLLQIILGMSVIGFFAGRARAKASVGGDISKLHSRLGQYGWHVFILCMVPAALVAVVWILVQAVTIPGAILSNMPTAYVEGVGSNDLIMTQVQGIANGLDILGPEKFAVLVSDPEALKSALGDVGVAVSSTLDLELINAAERFSKQNATWSFWRNIVVLGVAVAGFLFAFGRTNSDFRARNTVEAYILSLLIASASVAILTTIGIVLSMLFETSRFFGEYSWTDFFFGLEWAAHFRGNSSLGFLPLLWGTLYISLIALLVAVPIGLFAAIYLSEYASPWLRGVAKPMLEVLAGIPTIVYGLFALTTFGPMLLGLFGPGGALGVTWMGDSRSVMTAGIVMGIMLIPFVSSLSDDIINAVPQALRDGSYGLGATQSETVRQVILPAALPGIVGSILLAASRAIGETMIVVMGAGATAVIFYESPDRYLNPFEIMTTITTRIVAQLTGDGQFDSPETLVAFALGLTLFFLTLLLNVYALYIVRRYQEQYT